LNKKKIAKIDVKNRQKTRTKDHKVPHI